jgi:hypothetical protein
MATSISERPERNEEALIAEMETVLRRQMEHSYPAGATKRDAHPKHTGLVEATFTVAPDVPPALRVGLFSAPGSYPAWVRTSSASGKPQSDAIPDVRGFAIKVRDVGGEKIPESDEPHTQDFVLLSTSTMPLGTVRLFRDAIVLIERSRLLFAAKMILTGHGRVLKELEAARILPSSPLDIRYWSTTPYRFGPDRAAKYSLVPTAGVRATPPDAPGETYLTDAMEQQLAAGGYAFDFMVQLQTGDLPIENAAVPWPESVAPFVKVAALSIPTQAVRTPERSRMAELLSFSPAHARVEHRPLGSVNRARMRIYRTLSDFRHARDGAQHPNRT